MNGYYEAEAERQRRARAWARDHGYEVLTTAVASRVFGVSGSAVRQARVREHVKTRLTLQVSGQPVPLLDMRSAIEYWGKVRLDFDAVLDEMRQDCHTFALGWAVYNILHDKPIVRLASADLE